MTFWTLIRRSLRFHARAHFGVVIGAAIGSAALIGALVVGDSVRETLRHRALEGLGQIEFALSSADRFITEQLAFRLELKVRDSSPRTNSVVNHYGVTPIGALVLPAFVSRGDSTARANHVTLIGMRSGGTAGEGFGLLKGGEVKSGEVWLNDPLVAQLRVRAGDVVVFRVRKMTGTSGEVAISPRAEPSDALRLRVAGVRDVRELGNFQLRPGATPPLNAFLNLEDLQRAINLQGRINTLLGDHLPGRNGAQSVNKSLEHYADGLKATLQLADLEAALVCSNGACELRTKRVFLDPPIVRAALGAGTNGQPILTYLANLITSGTNQTPYSMVTAAGSPYTPTDMLDDETILSQWIADDLRARPGDTVTLSYFLPESGAKLEEGTKQFKVRTIVPIESPWSDKSLMPDFPGIEKAESTSDWDAGFPLVYKIRPKDEDYWRRFRGTPKAFITLAAGQKLWANRFGKLTAIRFPLPPGSDPVVFRDALERKILAGIDPAELGLRFEPVREQALHAAEQSQDFGQLFLGFSIFLVVAALLLMALLFQFDLEQRIAEVGTLLALGFTPKQVRRLLLAEGVVLAFIGGVVGALGGLAYAKAMLWGLMTIWRRAVGMSSLDFHVTGMSLVIGLCSAVVVSVLTIWLTLRKQARRPARELLAGEVQSPKSRSRSRGAWIAWGAGIAAVGIVGWELASSESANAEVFFSAGALLLITGMGAAAAWLGRQARAGSASRFSLGGLGWRSAGRRRTRSLATIALLASGCFVIAAIGVFRLDANADAARKSSGTGGFALIGEATIPIVQDLNTKAGREFFGLSERDLENVAFVPMRVHEGDDASCLNLNHAQQPRLLGVKPEALAGRFTFTSVEKGLDSKRGWELLIDDRKESAPANSALAEEIPAVGDSSSIEWALHKKIGDTIDYTDERGRTFKLRLVGAVANSILQGSLIIDEAEFIKRFPSESGHPMFLIDVPSNSVTQVSVTLSRALQDAGMELTSAAERLNAFNAVQNTYLGTFQVLGGLGLLLGSAGLGVVVLRNVLERRGELGLLAAVGFRRRELQRLVLTEHGLLLGVGLGLGLLAAAVAVLPALLSSSGQLPYISLALTLAAICGNGFLWTWLATRYALRGDLLRALRNE
jgi:ABC-type antimicrobial peptide transport system permease subunit